MVCATMIKWFWTVWKAWLCGRVYERKEALIETGIWVLARERSKTATASKNQCLNVHFKFTFADHFLILFLVTQTTAFQAFTIVVISFYPVEETQELIEFCKVNGVFLNTCETMCHMVALNEASVPVPGKLVSVLTICHITYSPSFYFFTLRTAYSSSESIVFFLWNSAWKVPKSITWRLTLWAGTAEMKHLGLKRPLSARPQGHPLQTRMLQSSAHIFPPKEEYILNGYMILNSC